VSAVVGNQPPCTDARQPLVACADPARVLAWRGTRPVTVTEFLADVAHAAAALPALQAAANLCEDRYAFLVAFCAVACRGQANLLPPSRAAQAVAETLAAHPGSYGLGDGVPEDAANGGHCLRLSAHGASAAAAAMPDLAGDDTVAIGFTSGSTGVPKANSRTWAQFQSSSANNVRLFAQALELAPGAIGQVVATVPPQHMYGLEFSVLLPLTGPFAVHAGRPLFPADVAAALAEVPAPRLLVTTPVHLRLLVESNVELPPLAAITSATAALPTDLARLVETRFGAPLIEVFGSTETCVIAHRRPAHEEGWHLYPGIELRPRPDGTEVHAAHLPGAVALQDVVQPLPARRFLLCGRNSDLLEIAGKRASLADLTRRLQALPGVADAVVFQLDAADAAGVARIAALVVAPGGSEAGLLAELRRTVDPVFLPRPLRLVEALPRNETGKLPRAALLAAVAGRR
jgi:acyl-coenzyme A synthetase/AMP-(fatty) acid ligase